MTLFNIDKGNDNRKNPQLNQNDVNDNRMAHNTTAITYKTDTSTYHARVIFKNGLTLYYDDMNRVIAIDGFEPRLVPYPVRIQAKYGYDVYVDILGITAPTT